MSAIRTISARPLEIGEALLSAGLVTDAQLDAAIARQDVEGGTLGQHLVLSGAIGRRELYDEMARRWRAERVDLIAEPPELELVAQVSYPVALREGWIPWRRDGAVLVVATTVAPTDRLRQRILQLVPALDVRFRVTTPWDLWRAVEAGHRSTLLFESQDKLATEQPLDSAAPGLRLWQRWMPAVALAALAVFLVLDPADGFVAVLSGANLVFTASVLFKSAAALLAPWRRLHRNEQRRREVRERRRRGLPPRWSGRRSDTDLPEYTVLVPVYREANIVAKVMANIGSLDYPKSKLDVLLLLEADDEETIAVARAMRPPEYVRIVVVPPGSPQTKPRACNYGLALARGEFCVIYDAEDRPHPGQLREAVDAFDRDDALRSAGLGPTDPLGVVQAPLYYFNADYNVLTRLFAIEYAHWFEAMLPGMDAIGMPLPLGGTSNHFRVDALREMGGWDPYNVTDADAGLRAKARGFRVAVIDSGTGEEACAETGAWIRQRTRWIKGYLVTAAVNTRHPLRFARSSGVRGVIGLLGLIVATPVAFLAYPLALGFTAATYIGVQFVGLHLPEWVETTSMTTFVFGNLLMIVSAGIAATSRYNWRIGLFAVFLPAYWLLHSVAAWRAVYQVVRDPHRWEKTPHGLTEDYESDAHV